VSLSDFEDTIYKVEDEDLYLIATSEHTLLALHMDEILDGKTMPLRYCGVSPCFRKEAGAHGRDTRASSGSISLRRLNSSSSASPKILGRSMRTHL